MPKPIELDTLDHQIIDLLHQDGRMPYTTIAKHLNVAEATVRKRVSRLLDEGVVHVVGITDPARTGRPVTAIVGVHTEGNEVEEIVREVQKWDEVRFASVCAGTYDLILEVAVATNEELFTFLTKRLRAVPGVAGSDTSLVMKVAKERYQWKGVSPNS